MKKLLSICLFFLLLFNISELNAKLKLSTPENIPAESSLFTTTVNDNISLSDKELKSSLNLAIPESLIKMQSEYAMRAKMLLMLHLILAFPTGNFGDAYSTGIGANATFGYMLYPYLMLTASLGYLSWGSAEDIPGVDISASSVPFLLGVRYLFASQVVLPYVRAELGLNFMSISSEVPFFGEVSASDTKFTLGLGGGLMYALTAAILLDLNLRYWIISDAGNFTIMAGAAYQLPQM